VKKNTECSVRETLQCHVCYLVVFFFFFFNALNGQHIKVYTSHNTVEFKIMCFLALKISIDSLKPSFAI